MKKTAIVLGAVVLTLMVGFSIVSIAYAGDDWTPFTVNNNLGVLLDKDIHAPAVAPGKCEVRNYGPGEMAGIKDVEQEGIGSVSIARADNNLGVLLAADRDITEAKGSGAGGVADEKCAMSTKKEMKSGSIFDEIYGYSTTFRPF